MKIIITGATGSLGAALTRHFAGKGHDVTGTGRMDIPPKNLSSFAQYLKADISVPYELPDADICIHTAALSDDAGAWPDYYTANIEGTRNTVIAARNCKTFIHISSSSVYMPSDKPLTENMAGKQNTGKLSLYGYSKLLAEEMLLNNSKHDTCFILRPRAIYGPGDKVILPRMLKLVRDRVIQRPGSMKVGISMTHYSNLIHAIECCLKSKMTGIHIYNVSDAYAYIFIDIIRKLTEALYGKPLSEKHVPVAVLKFMSWFHLGGISPLLVRTLTHDMVLDITKIKSELNYDPTVDFDSSLKELAGWVKRIGGVDVIRTGAGRLAWEY
jgi:nucleoside-diphosphate-sugar epimerase